MKIRSLVFLLAIAALVGLSACSPAQTPSPTLTPTETEMPKPSATLTPVPTETPLPTPTVTPTLVPSATQTATLTSTPRPTFAGFQVEYPEYTKNGLQLVFRIPGNRQNYRLEVNGTPYTCALVEKYPDRLYCLGPVFAQNTQVKLVFFPLEGEKQPVFETTYRITPLITPTVDVRIGFAAFKKKCPEQEDKITCETEYRKIGSACCIVATCSDACGNFFSANTCPRDMAMEGICPGKPPIP
jgi:hypothetical protein